MAEDQFIPEPGADGELVSRLTSQQPGTAPSPVTHWHLTLTEIGTFDPSRYSKERWEQIDLRGFESTTDDPARALAWITEQRAAVISRASDPAVAAKRRGWHTREDWERSALVSWEVLMRSPRTPAGGGLAVRSGWSVEIYAIPMSPMDCSRSH